MNIGQFIASTGWGGAEKAFVELTNALSETDEVKVLALRGSLLIKRLNPNIEVITLPKTSRFNLYLYWYLLRFIQNNELDIIHTHAAKASTVVCNLSRFVNLKQIATKHNSRPNKVFNQVDHVIAVSQQVAETIQGGATVIHNGITPKKITHNINKSDVFTILAVGRLDPIKGFADLIKQAATLLDFEFQLQIVGEGPELIKLRSLKAQTGLSSIKLLGFREDVPELMSAADLVVINSVTEGLSLVLIESLFYGNVLISTPVSGSKEILPSRFLFERGRLAEKIKDVYENYAIYQEAFDTVKKRYQDQFIIKTIARAHIEYYRQLLSI